MIKRLNFEVPCEYVSDSLCLLEDHNQNLPEDAEIRYYNKKGDSFDEYLMIDGRLDVNHEVNGDFMYDSFFRITGYQIDFKQLEKIAEKVKEEIEILTEYK